MADQTAMNRAFIRAAVESGLSPLYERFGPDIDRLIALESMQEVLLAKREHPEEIMMMPEIFEDLLAEVELQIAALLAHRAGQIH